jgi:Na+-transporting NADH:ubiquinone oxidoreductase subunit F
MNETSLAVVLFTSLIMVLVFAILAARRMLVPRGSVEVVVNEQRTLVVPRSAKLLEALDSAGIHLPSACGGKGTCGQCRIAVADPAPAPAPTEIAMFDAAELAAGARLACQIVLRDPLSIRVPDAVFGVKRWTCRVRSTRCVGTLLKEIVAELPVGEKIDFRAGAFVQVTAPPYRADYRDLPIDETYRAEWDKLGLWRHSAGTDVPVARAYSLANHPGESDCVMLIIRLAIPPSRAPEGTPGGVVSSYLYRLEPGSEFEVAGPYGDFFARETDAEMIFVAGGAGMAPMRSLILDQLLRVRSPRPIRFFYGARSRREVFYDDLFDRLAAEHPNFRWTLVLSEPEPGWEGEVGFVHEILHARHLAHHPAPERCEYYLCGPPLMALATQSMLAGLGVPRENVFFDDFGT